MRLLLSTDNGQQTTVRNIREWDASEYGLKMLRHFLTSIIKPYSWYVSTVVEGRGVSYDTESKQYVVDASLIFSKIMDLLYFKKKFNSQSSKTAPY